MRWRRPFPPWAPSLTSDILFLPFYSLSLSIGAFPLFPLFPLVLLFFLWCLFALISWSLFSFSLCVCFFCVCQTPKDIGPPSLLNLVRIAIPATLDLTMPLTVETTHLLVRPHQSWGNALRQTPFLLVVWISLELKGGSQWSGKGILAFQGRKRVTPGSRPGASAIRRTMEVTADVIARQVWKKFFYSHNFCTLLHRMLEESPDCQPTLTSGSLASNSTWCWRWG